LARLIEKTPITIKEWHRQKDIHKTGDLTDPLKLGFATFYLNRTNRSGVIKGGGVIGGLSQLGTYKLDCRFNRQDLVRRIRRIAKYRNRIHLSNLDAIVFMRRMSSKLPEQSFFCIDPPYFNKGSSLYTNFYGPDEHSAVADAVLKLNHHWIVTYDCTEKIKQLYCKRRQFVFDINYSVQTKCVGTELLIASRRLRLPAEIKARQVNPPKRTAA
jgi:DNA adenine methylase